MDCEQVGQLLDAYALGAAEADEAARLEAHVADCVRCWSSLNEAQQAAAAIALSTAFQRAPASLRNRILAETERGERLGAPKLMQLLRRLWPVGAGIVTAAAVASLTFAFFLQAEVDDLRDENVQLEAQVEDAGEMLNEQRQLMAILAAPDVQQVRLDATDHTTSAGAVYQWSSSAGTGALLCNNLPALQEGQEYKVWFLTQDHSYEAGSFQTWDGIGQLAIDLEDLPELPIAIGVSIEHTDAQEPGEMFLFAEFER
ncbi:MAG: anti-sigma factor [Chloroflexi bacterium]|nr:anti-sigma factor [Chloroflexota bacterium]